MRRLSLITLCCLPLLLLAACSDLKQIDREMQRRELRDEGIEAFQEQDYDLALRSWEHAFKLDPTDADMAFLVSAANANLGREEEALAWLRNALKLSLIRLTEDADLDPLRGEAEFQRISALGHSLWEPSGSALPQPPAAPAPTQ